jgi:signal transduction histidine kinase/CheY-like chemotaxis protein
MWAMWAVLRFGAGGAAAAMLVIGIPALVATVHGMGPFVRADRPIPESLVRLLIYLVLWSGFFQIAGAIMAERERAVAELAKLNRELEDRVRERTLSLSEAGEALRASESKLRSYYEAAPLFMGLVELEEDDVLHLYDNPASCRYFCVPPGSTAGKRSREFATVPAAIEIWINCFRVSAQSDEPTRFERAFPVGRDGERWLSITVTPLASEGSERRRFSYVAEDVTGRRRTETALRKHAARQTALLEVTRAIFAQSSNLAALAVALFHRVEEVLEADLGLNYLLDPHDQTLRLIAGFGLPDDRALEAQQLPLLTTFCGTVAAEGNPIMADETRIDADPKGAFLRSLGARSYVCHPLLAGDGRILGTLSFASTKRGRFEPEEVNFLQTLCHYVALAWERAAAGEEMARAKDAAESANRAKDDFLAALSHELRTPLNPVLLLASELQNQKSLSPEVHADLATIRRNVELEARLIDDLLDLTRITRGKVSLEVRPTPVHRVLRESLEILEAEVAAKELRLVWNLEARRDIALADPVRLQQVLWNVLRNAIKFTPPSGAVTLGSHEAAGGRFVLEISDTGPGIASEHLGTIFETFNQGAGGHRFGGLGLGLAIARSIVEMHGGSIQAESAGNGQGATFRIELPLLQGVPGSATSTDLDPAEAPPEALPSLRILLVEDHEPTRTALSRLLQRRRHEVTPVENLASARRAAEEQHFDLLISDLGLPDGDGVDLMRHFQASGGPPGIALSGYGMDEDLRRTRAAGFFAHLVKPVDVDMLDRTLELWNRQTRVASANGNKVAEVTG